MPERPQHHGGADRMNLLLEQVSKSMPKGTQTAGRPTAVPQNTFGRLFDCAPTGNLPEVSKLQDLARNHMTDDGAQTGEGAVPSGIAFFGQFIDHDLTFDVTTVLGETSADPMQIQNFRSPRLDLDSVYLHGPEVSPFMYDQGGRNGFAGFLTFGHANALDLPRARNKRAIIGDPRNDENIFISQIHGRQFIQLHNSVLDHVSAGSTPTKQHFELARDLVRTIYHNRIVTEFLPAVVDSAVLNPLLAAFNQGALPNTPINWAAAPDMPIEFSAAAFRFGHTMIREGYQLSEMNPVRRQLFELGGFQPVSAEDNLDFNLFFDHGDGKFQHARKIDTKISNSLLNLPARVAANPSNLAERNMIRGQITYLLPSGETVASAMGVQPLPTHPAVAQVGLQGNTPLWFYILAEAEAAGGKLGAVGGNIVAGVILNAILRGRRGQLDKGFSLLDDAGLKPGGAALQSLVRKSEAA